MCNKVRGRWHAHIHREKVNFTKKSESIKVCLETKEKIKNGFLFKAAMLKYF